MRIDLHTHSDRSDGTDAPAELIAKAVEAGLDVVALTDHDATEGWAEALQAAKSSGIRLVKGIEISCRLEGKSIHLLGYNFDPAERSLAAELERVIEGRNSRLPRTIERLQRTGINIDEADVRRWSVNAVATGRPHVADALVELKVVDSRNEAFEKYLMPGRPGYVDHYAADLFDAIGLLHGAGGRAVIAHPWSRGRHRVLTAARLGELRDAGLDGIEVDHNDHDAEARSSLRFIGRDLGLIITGSSDYHGTGKTGFDLGCNLTDEEQYDRLMPF